jgi:hypothetical protein
LSNYKFNIRQYYQPLQPTAGANGSPVDYQEILPAKSLQDFIYCYWFLKNDAHFTIPYQYRVVADGCVDLFFDVNNPADSQLMGFCKKYTEFPLSGRFHYVGVRFFPAVFPRLFHINAAEISNRIEQLQFAIPDLANFITARIAPGKSMDDLAKILDAYFLRLIAKIDFEWDGRFYRALQTILARQGHLHLEKELNTGLSSRQLRRLFHFYIGDSGKVFSKVIQFQKLIACANAPKEILKQRAYYDLGYYDQPHFIKDFKRFYGVSPKLANH